MATCKPASAIAAELRAIPGLPYGVKAKDLVQKFGCTLPVAYNAIQLAHWAENAARARKEMRA